MTLQSTLTGSIKLSAALAVLGLGTVITPAAMAGEAFVNNTHRNSWGYSETNLNIESDSFSNGNRQFASYADKIFIDGKIELPKAGGDLKLIKTDSKFDGHQPHGKTVAFDKFTVHTASSSEFGSEEFGSTTQTEGTIKSFEKFDEVSHTTSAGVR